MLPHAFYLEKCQWRTELRNVRSSIKNIKKKIKLISVSISSLLVVLSKAILEKYKPLSEDVVFPNRTKRDVLVKNKHEVIKVMIYQQLRSF